MSAIRLTFSVLQGKPEFSGAQAVNMRVRRPRYEAEIARESGVWLEVRGKGKESFYSTILDDLTLSPMIEVRTGVGDPGMTVVKSRARQLMHVIVPDTPGARSFHILRREKRGGKVREILSGSF